jgi:ribosomal protein S18 acetylase RimI-like enzyme
MCSVHGKNVASEYDIRRLTLERDRQEVCRLVKTFWGEEEQLAFDQKFSVSLLPGYVARRNRVIGFILTAEADDDLIIVALGVLPQDQHSGIGRALVEKVHEDAVRTKRSRILVSTSNDDLPALAFYQSMGFQMYEVKPDVIAEKHGKALAGIGGIPVRDEVRLQKKLR